MAAFFEEGKLNAIKAIVSDMCPTDPQWHRNRAEMYALELRGMLICRAQLRISIKAGKDFEWEALKLRCHDSRVDLIRSFIAEYYMLALHMEGKRQLVSTKPVFA